jgi:hypothetical protein
MGIKVSLFDTQSAVVEKTEFTLNDDDYVDIDDDDYIILDNNYKDKIKPEMIVVEILNEDKIIKHEITDIINHEMLIKDINEKIIADKLVDDIISNVVYDITTNKKNKKNKKKKRKNIW